MREATIAVDIGASSGRLIIGYVALGRLILKEVHRFKNTMKYVDHHYVWDVDYLYEEIIRGLKAAGDSDMTLISLGIDTWAVDYVLVDDKGERVSYVFAYRDHRTDDAMNLVFNMMPSEVIYGKTGIQFQQFNTLYQLFAHKRENKEDFDRAQSLLLIPDYLNYKLSGVKAMEYTNATSTQLLNVHSKTWDDALFDMIQVESSLMAEVITPGTVLGHLKDDLQAVTNCNGLKVIAPATHDTGSAIVSIPALEDDFAYISSGTWSLMGIESQVPIADERARHYNFTNEGGVFGTFRVLKNIMGLWLIQEVARMYDDQYSFAELVIQAQKAKAFEYVINPNDPRFINPDNMIEAIQGFCRETGQNIPTSPGEIARCIFEGLAFLYRDTLIQLREISDQPINKIHIIGGGCQNKLLNQMCADFTGCVVYAGPIEATAIGNLTMQMIATGTLKDLKEARQLVMNSFNIEVYEPEEIDLAVVRETFEDIKKSRTKK